VNGQLAVGRLGARSDADLAWETDLLQRLDRAGLTVPVPIATTDGRLFADGLVVMTYVEGEPPETKADWRRVAEVLCQLHRLTQDWPQRPGWRSSTDLLTAESGTGLICAPCQLRASPGAEQRGRGSSETGPASYTGTPTPATFA
jgi:Ser/Thr protein kinase RdoA (MazF antagonist)